MGRLGQASVLLIALAAVGLLVVSSQYPTGFSTFSFDQPNLPESTIDNSNPEQPTIFGGGSGLPGGGGVQGSPATNASCGDTITSNLTLDGDLDCSGYSGNALTIGANNVVLDCNGYTITGPGAGAYYGVYASGRTGVTIKNCVITNFYTGIYLVNVKTSQVTANVVKYSYGANGGINLESGSSLGNFATNNIITNNQVINNTYYGIRVRGANNLARVNFTTITGNYVYNNGGDGLILLVYSMNNTIIGNYLCTNGFSDININTTTPKGNSGDNNCTLRNIIDPVNNPVNCSQSNCPPIGGGAVCGNGAIESGEQCDDGNTNNGDCCSSTCQYEASGTSCSDGQYCNGAETCNGIGSCQAGTPVDCSANDISAIGRCDNVPDGNPLTWDHRAAFISTCAEATDSCTTGDPTVISDAPTPGVCGVGCLTDNDCNHLDNDYCDGTLAKHDEGVCQVDSTCGVQTTTQQDCYDGLWCNGAETCYAGACVAGTPIDCNDNIACTVDSCNEATDECIYDASGCYTPGAGAAVLIAPFYSSSATNPALEDTTFTITNNGTSFEYAHLFYVSGSSSSSIADYFICLLPGETVSFSAYNKDIGKTGYLVAVTSDANGVAVGHNVLIGNASFTRATGHYGTYDMIGFKSVSGSMGPSWSYAGNLSFDGTNLERLPRMLDLTNIPSNLDGNNQRLVLVSPVNDLAIGGFSSINIPNRLYGSTYNSQFLINQTGFIDNQLGNTWPRTVPRFDIIIPSGQTGRMTVEYIDTATPVVGLYMNVNPGNPSSDRVSVLQTSALLSSYSITYPIFPPAPSLCNRVVCGNGVVETGEQCDDGNTNNGDCCSSTCQYEASGTSCSDGQYCNGAETCNGIGSCQAGTPVDCSYNDLAAIATCFNSPDSNPLTWDEYAGFTSMCDESLDACTTGTVTVTSTCSVSSCGAECDAYNTCDDNTCSQTYDDYCNGYKLVEYDNDRMLSSITVSDSCSNSCLGDCTCTNCDVDCSPPATNTYCVKDVCNAACDSNDDCPATGCQDLNKCVGKNYWSYTDVPNTCMGTCDCTQNACGSPTISYNDPRCTECQTDADCNKLDKDYCDGDIVKHDEGACINYDCQPVTTTVQDCNTLDNSYCSGSSIRHDDYTCSAAACILDSTTIVQECDDGAWCNGAETCLNAACVAGTAPYCADTIACTDDSCDEVNDMCKYDPNNTKCPTADTCDDASGYVWTGICDASGGCIRELAPAEICNGLDDDCDGLTDEDLTQPTTCGVGACASTGQLICVNGQTQDTCTPLSPGVETNNCGDNIDNDCDGLYDCNDINCNYDDLCGAACIDNDGDTYNGGNQSSYCGDGTCGSTETYVTCPSDCEPPGIPIPNCQTISASGKYYLSRDVSALTYSTCININANNVILDCNGYAIIGPGIYGINLNGRTGVTIKNCNLTNGWNNAGIRLRLSSNNTLTNNIANNNAVGIQIQSSNNNIFTNNTANNNYAYGVYLTSSNNNILTGNTANNNYEGILLQYSVNNNILTGNTANNNTYNGIWVYEGSNNILTSNTANNNRYGIDILASSSNTLTGNNVCSSTIYDIYIRAGSTLNNGDNYCNASKLMVEDIGNTVTCSLPCQYIGSMSGSSLTAKAKLPAATTGAAAFSLAATIDCGTLDCNDNNPNIYPGATEVCNNVDDNCDMQIDEDLGTTTCGLGICEHTIDNCVNGQTQTCDPYEGATTEVCDNLDNDCDGLVDEGGVCCTDEDGDGYEGTPYGCGPDCDDTNENVHPGATEICNNVDDDCDPMTADGSQEPWINQPTSCGIGVCASTGMYICQNGMKTDTCMPGDPTGIPETVCNGFDDDCDNAIDEDYVSDTSCFLPGACASGNVPSSCISGVETYCQTGTPTTETCNGIDDDCDGTVDDGLGTTTCGLGVCMHTIDNCVNGQTQTCDPMQGATYEICNGLDDDCDGSVDEVCSSTPMCDKVNRAGAYVGTLNTYIDPNGDLIVYYNQSTTVNDNTYGTGAIGWPNGHSFSALTGSDMAEFIFKDATGKVVLDFKVDYLSASTIFASGYGSLNVSGGDGSMISGNKSYIMSATTSLDYNFNVLGCKYTVNSPPAYANYTPMPTSTCPAWLYADTYTVKISKSAFGTAGFGSVAMGVVHDSPPKDGKGNAVYPTPCTPVGCAGTDADNDGYSTNGTDQGKKCCMGNTMNCLQGVDCNDNSPTVHPFAIEVCNGIDDDCDGEIDESCSSADKQSIITTLTALNSTYYSKMDSTSKKELAYAINEVTLSLGLQVAGGDRQISWIDSIRIACKHGYKVFYHEKKAAYHLSKIGYTPLKNNITTLQLISKLVAIDRLLAVTAIADAIAAGNDPKDIAKANEKLAKGDAESDFKKKIQYYKDAWKYANKDCVWNTTESCIKEIYLQSPGGDFVSVVGDEISINTTVVTDIYNNTLNLNTTCKKCLTVGQIISKWKILNVTDDGTLKLTCKP